MASTPTKLMTFAEFAKLPDDPRGWRAELRQGEVVTVPPPLHGHYRIQQRLRKAFEKHAGQRGEACIEFGYRPTPHHNYWEADVAFVALTRWEQIPPDGNLQGPPELVVELLSASNTLAEIRNKKRICLENGCQEFWVVDRDGNDVEVSTPDGHTVTYKTGQSIPLFFAPGQSIAAAEIFA